MWRYNLGLDCNDDLLSSALYTMLSDGIDRQL